jgi:hypothetical protein
MRKIAQATGSGLRRTQVCVSFCKEKACTSVGLDLADLNSQEAS